MNKKIISFNIGKKSYFTFKNNYLIIDFINKKIGTKLLFKKILFFNNNKIFFDKNNLNFKIFAIIIKHFKIKTLSIKKKRRKNIIKKNVNYKKKSLLFIDYII